MKGSDGRVLIGLLVVAACTATSPAFAGAQARQGAVAGLVLARTDSLDTRPAPGATITVVGTTLVATTGSSGRFILDRVPAGPATLRVRLLGHRLVERSITVVGGDTARVEILLEADARLLAPVRVEADATDIEQFLARPNVATIVMGADAMENVPTVGEPDVVRVVQLLPGVAARNDYNTSFNVRGGDADQNLILLDGHPIYNPFHLGGLFSTFMDATVGGIELLTGAFPARYGGRLSSVLDVRSAEDVRPGVHATADVSVLAASARVNGALGSRPGTWSIAARRTYADAATRLFTNDVFPYHFADVHAHASMALGRTTRLALTLYGGRDVLDAEFAEQASDSAPSRASEGQWGFEWGNRVAGATLAKELGSRVTLTQRITLSHFSTLLDLGDGSFAQRSRLRETSAAGSISRRGTTHDLSAGYEIAWNRLRYVSGSDLTGAREFDLVQRPVTGALWIDDVWRVSPRLIVQSGVRGEALRSRDWVALSPRVSLKFLLSNEFALTAGAGRVTQTHHSLAGDGPFRYFDVWLASDEYTPVATAWHWVMGAERRVRDVGSVRVEGYVKRFDRVMEANWSENPGVRGDEFHLAQGRAYGVDLLARWLPAEGIGGWIAYSYGVSRRWRDTLRWAPGHDRRHDIDIVGTSRIGRYRLGVRFGFATGTPYTPMVGEIARRVYDPSTDHWGTGHPIIRVEPLGGDRFSARYPATHRLDLDVSRSFVVRGWSVRPYVSIVNVYNAPNVFLYDYDYSTATPTRRAISQFPTLPSIGVRVAF